MSKTHQFTAKKGTIDTGLHAFLTENDGRRCEIKTVNFRRTQQQNSALYLFFTQLADHLNASGKDMRVILKPSYSIDWRKDRIHDDLWIPFQKAILGSDSTKELDKVGDIDRVHEVLMKALGEKHGVEYLPFPHETLIAPMHTDSYGS